MKPQLKAITRRLEQLNDAEEKQERARLIQELSFYIEVEVRLTSLEAFLDGSTSVKHPVM